MLLPSSGGKGMRLKTKRSRLSEKENAGESRGEQRGAMASSGCDDMCGADLSRQFKPTPRDTKTDEASSDKHEQEVRGWTGHCHDSGAARMTVCPGRIIGSAGPADHPAAEHVGDDRNDDHAKGFSFYVRRGIERYLASAISGVVAETICAQRMAGFVDGGGKEERHIPTRAVKK